MISPAALHTLQQLDATLDNSITTDADRIVGLKTWLGFRYDRPAVPPQYVDLARSIAGEVKKQRSKLYTAKVRDILMDFEEGDPPLYNLYAVIQDPADHDEIVSWLVEVSLAVPHTLGVGARFEAATSENTSLALIERAFAADTTQITWGGRSLRGLPGRFSRP